jgi:hypothetical protein
MGKPDAIGPWVPDLPEAERLARYRSLRALVGVFAPGHPLAAALARAESDPTDAAALEAWRELMGLPSLRRRRILASMGTLLRNTPPTGGKKIG